MARNNKEITKLVSRLARDLHDDVANKLVRIAMQAELLEADSDTELGNAFKEIARESRLALSNIKDTIWSNDPKNLLLGNFFDKITEISQNSGNLNSIHFLLNFDPNLNDVVISPDEKHEIFYILKEAILQISKTNVGDEVNIRIFEVKNEIIFELFNNNGVNLEETKSGEKGISIMKSRAEVIGAKIEFENTNGFLLRLSINMITGN